MAFKSRIIDVFFFKDLIEYFWEWDFVDHVGFNLYDLDNDHSSIEELRWDPVDNSSVVFRVMMTEDEYENFLNYLFKKIIKENCFDALEKTAIKLTGIEEIGKCCTRIDVYSKNVFGQIISIEALI